MDWFAQLINNLICFSSYNLFFIELTNQLLQKLGYIENLGGVYENFSNQVKGFIAQGSESGFGKKYARGINDSALNQEDKFIQIVSCNTHNISCLTKTIAFNEDSNNNLDKGDFICIRRANDLSQEDGFIPAPKVGIHENKKFGTHHAKDAHGLFRTIGENLNLYSSAMKVNSQYMHILRFKFSLNDF